MATHCTCGILVIFAFYIVTKTYTFPSKNNKANLNGLNGHSCDKAFNVSILKHTKQMKNSKVDLLHDGHMEIRIQYESQINV